MYKYDNLLHMSDNIVRSTDINKKTEEKPVAKKTTAKKVAKPKTIEPNLKDGYKIIVFESGASYNSTTCRFTRQDNIKELPEEEAELLLKLDNFRLPSDEEVQNYFASRED